AEGGRRGDGALAAAAASLWRAAPALGANHLLRFGTLRIFGPRGDTGGVVRNSRRQQGLLELVQTHCDQGLAGCATCPLLRALAGALPECGR
ncbi:MAG: hypothetical protein HZA54_03415, partial [Planctomycetes bacterium]|nr:hypothetical protein [Planctomycetota bacterium]